MGVCLDLQVPQNHPRETKVTMTFKVNSEGLVQKQLMLMQLSRKLLDIMVSIVICDIHLCIPT